MTGPGSLASLGDIMQLAYVPSDFDAALKDTRASVTEAMERDYEKIQGEIKQAAMSVDPIGFFAPGMLKPVREQKHEEPRD